MSTNRRDFLKTSGLLGLGLGLNASPALASSSHDAQAATGSSRVPEKSPNPKRILIFGGTGFIGPNTVNYAVERGHWVSIFTRGRTEADIPASVEQLIGDRNDNHDALMGREWDVVIDNNTSRDYRWVQRSTEILKDAVGHYIFVSSISAYDPANQVPSEEPLMEPLMGPDYPLAPAPDGWTDGEPLEYGPMKAYAERICHEAFPGRCTVVRPGLIVGPGDPTNRFTYWPTRVAEGGEILCPGNPMHANQIIDQRDLTEWIVRLAEDGTTGDFNGVGPGWRMSMAEMIYGLGAAFNTERTFTWVTEEFLQEQGVSAWSDLPSWMPGAPLMYADNSASVAAGLTFRPLAVIGRDTHEWNMTRTQEERDSGPFGMSREREAEVLAAWHASRM
jgi:2'-hydroxyisoflavone reductase